LFNKTQRAFSSGCIRIEHPFELAELVLNRPQEWNQRRFDEIRASRRTQTVMLERPLPVLLLYFTAEVDTEGRMQFREDLYGRDRRVLAALDGQFVFRPPAALEARLKEG
jgi:murein L,D-transpeptidase YcbB/YkuD